MNEPTGVFEYSILVQESDTDMIGHVNNVVYLQWMQDAAMAHSAAMGWPAERYQAYGAGWVARLHQIRYLRAAYPGDRIIIRTWVATMGKVQSTRRYEMFRQMQESPPSPPPTHPSPSTAADAVLVVAHTEWAFIDFATRGPKRIPNEIASCFRIIADD
jgi:acyl-CoA thioester hydrolase